MMVKFKTFNTKVIGTQVLIFALGFSVLGILFIRKIENVRIVAILTLIFVVIVGYFLIRSVKKQKSEIEHLLKIKSEFIGVVSHQLRTPVSVIKGMASMLKEGDLDKASKEKRDFFISGIFEKSEKLASILEDILKAQELDIDNFMFIKSTIKPINLAELLKGIFDDLSNLAEKKKLIYKINIDPEVMNLDLATDSMFLGHVFRNIIDNAIKYSKDNGQVIVYLYRDGEYFICKIKDSGIGVPPDEKVRLFEKFFRAKNAVDTYAYGTGLGLFIAKKIIEAHIDGKIWFESVLNKGTVFYIRLPIIK